MMIEDMDDWSETLLVRNTDFSTHDVFYAMRLLWTITKKPDFAHAESHDNVGFISLPFYLQMTQLPMDSLYFYSLIISMHDPDDYALIDQIALELKE